MPTWIGPAHFEMA